VYEKEDNTGDDEDGEDWGDEKDGDADEKDDWEIV
jgi:hypothetical protein